jgi:thiosulfate/3-mercaptopyruvate sulfurtransferase
MKFTPCRVKLQEMHHTALIDPAALAALLGQQGIAIVDCRFDLAASSAGREAYLKAHIPGAGFADLNKDLSVPPGRDSGRHPLPAREAFALMLGALGIDNGTQVVAYDQASGAFAARFWWMLRWVGHRDVAVLDGGFDAWLAEGHPVEAGPRQAPPGRFLLQAEEVRPVSSQEVLAATRQHERLIVDARAPERYSGQVEPLDSVAGHVPGAINAPFTANLGAAGRFLPAAELRRRWLQILGGKAPQELIAMCGSGVTACHNLLALEVAGLPGAALYAGSWSEWIRDPARPIATGSAP